MANDTKGNPLVIDSLGALLTTPVRVKSILFKPILPSDQVVLKDSQGRIVADLSAGGTTAERQVDFGLGGTRFYGLTADTLTPLGVGAFDGTGDYLTTPDSVDLRMATGDFTLEFDVVHSAVSVGQVYISKKLDANNYLQFRYDYGNSPLRRLWFRSATGGVSQGEFTTSTTLPWSAGVKHHVVFQRRGTTAEIYIDGVSQVVTVVTAFTETSEYSWAGALNIGDASGAGVYLNGKLKNLRISKGIARYSGTFTPPSRPFIPDSYTSLLLNFGGAEGSTDFIDSSANAHTITAGGDAHITTTVENYRPLVYVYLKK